MGSESDEHSFRWCAKQVEDPRWRSTQSSSSGILEGFLDSLQNHTDVLRQAEGSEQPGESSLFSKLQRMVVSRQNAYLSIDWEWGLEREAARKRCALIGVSLENSKGS